jgi:hypothetical protein
MESRLDSRLEEFIHPGEFNEKAPPGFDVALIKDLKGMKKSARRLDEILAKFAELDHPLTNPLPPTGDETTSQEQNEAGDDFWNHL